MEMMGFGNLLKRSLIQRIGLKFNLNSITFKRNQEEMNFVIVEAIVKLRIAIGNLQNESENY